VITDSEDRSMIAELEQIIQTEEAKPEAERDADLIDECIREIAELKGVKAGFSEEEVAEITDELIKKTDREKRKKHLVRIAAGIAAVFVLVGGVTACSVNPALIDWIIKTAKMPFGKVFEKETVTYICQGSAEEYDSVEELIHSKELNIYYPAILPNGIILEHVELFNDNGPIIGFKFNSDNFHYSIQLDSPIQEIKDVATSIVEANGMQFNVYHLENHYTAFSEIDGNAYTIQSSNIDNIIFFIGGLRKD